MKYNIPKMEIVQLEVTDIITSSPISEGENGTQDGDTVITTPKDWS